MVDVKQDLDEIKDKQDKLASTINKLDVVFIEITHLREELKEIKNTSKENNNEIFNRLRHVEAEKVGKRDVIAIVTVVGIVVTTINIVFKWVIG
jgi:septal ring factor EnvC (AmiA/AmiB activator)